MMPFHCQVFLPVFVKGTAERLMAQLVEDNSEVDSTYVEDFLLTHRTFIESPITVANQLLEWSVSTES